MIDLKHSFSMLSAALLSATLPCDLFIHNQRGDVGKKDEAFKDSAGINSPSIIGMHAADLGDFDRSFAGQEAAGNCTPLSCICCKSVCSCESLTVSLTDQQSLSAFAPASAWKLE